jgi:PPK2 family polyphosphate:nucleotide phosphotransferase
LNYRKKLVVEPGSKVRLADIDPAYRGKHDSHDEARPEIEKHVQKLDALQYLMYSEKKHALLIVLQGLDAGGKDGVIRHVISGMNPAGCRVAGFKGPTSEELAHDFLWRVHPHAPARGEVAIFNRSHYEDVLVARVHGLVPKAVWAPRYQLINDFEKLLAVENATTILKFFLHISKDEQLARFEERLDTPAKNWKISDADYKEREYWDQYEAAFEDVLSKTSTKHAPWFVIPANHKWFRDLAISAIIVDAMQAMKMRPPEPTVDLAEIRRLYHAAAATQDGRGSHKNKRAEQKVPLPRPAGR